MNSYEIKMRDVRTMGREGEIGKEREREKGKGMGGWVRMIKNELT